MKCDEQQTPQGDGNTGGKTVSENAPVGLNLSRLLGISQANLQVSNQCKDSLNNCETPSQAQYDVALQQYLDDLENVDLNPNLPVELPAPPPILIQFGVLAPANVCDQFNNQPPVPNLCFLSIPGCGLIRKPCSKKWLCLLATNQIQPNPPVCRSSGPNGAQPIVPQICQGNPFAPSYLCGVTTNNCPITDWQCDGMF
jgi:hypothetical protein